MRTSCLSFAVLLAILLQSGQADAQYPGVPGPSPIPSSTVSQMIAFYDNLPKGFARPGDQVEDRLLREYGAMFVARGSVNVPTVIVFRDDPAVTQFQKSTETVTEVIGSWSMTLQAPAMRALMVAIDEGKAQGLAITPRDVDVAGRSYSESVGLWASRVEPALDHWTRKARISAADAERLRALSPYGQVHEVLALEQRGVYFAKDLSKSILYSVAPPGASQHLAMLAFDVAEHGDARVRRILARNGWFQTVVSDLPHFTFLGVSEAHLPNLGLRKRNRGGRVFWVPDI